MSPKHRRCTRRRHHAWTYRQSLMGWVLATCTMCGETDLA